VVPKKKAPKQDGFIYREVTEADTVVPYAKVNPEDVVYTKRVWREIDLRDRGNEVLASPKVNLIAIIYDAVSNGELDMYPSNVEDWSVDPLNAKKAGNAKAGTSSTVDTAFLGVNPSTNEVNRANNEFFVASFTTIRIKEDWILDIKRGIFEPRIIGIAPVRIDVKTPVDNNGNPVVDPTTNTVRADTVKSVAGWIHFDDLREILVKHKVSNNQNDNSGINFDDVFVRRLFYSNITKVSNSADNRIEDILFNPKERLLESERYKKAMADFEQGLWEY
jgi:gliding motility associated protien GldN